MRNTRQVGHPDHAATSSRTLRTLRSNDRVAAALMPELDRVAISRRLGQARKQAGLTQHEMADAMQLHFRSVQNYESWKDDRVPFARLDEWAKITGTTKEWLLHGHEPLLTSAERLDAIEDELRRLTDEIEKISELLPVLEQFRAAFAQLEGIRAERGAAARTPRARRGAS
jgi:transcriptional regulator with XRE-family HTH domain